MRALCLCLALAPSTLWAEDFPLASDVTAVTLFPQGATVTRTVPFQVPAGQHRLILTDLPRTTPLQAVRVATTAGTLGSVTARADFVPPRTTLKDAVLKAAEDEVARLEDELRAGEAGVAGIRAEAEAARARVAFLGRLGAGEISGPLDVAALRDMAAMIGDKTQEALQQAIEADGRAVAADRGLKEVREALKDARQELAALSTEEEANAYLAVALAADAPAEGSLTVSYSIDMAGWTPVYDLKLDRAAGTLAIERGAFVRQATGENWGGVTLTLSTVRPSEQTAPSEVWPLQRRIEDPVQLYAKAARAPMAEAEADFALAEPAPMVEVAAASFDGLSVTYSYPAPVDIATDADRVRLALGTLSTEADVVARAAPLWDASAYLTAAITNDTGELILPTTEGMFYLDGRFVGQQALDLVPAGGEAELAFGPIEGVRLTRTVLDRNEGDRGVIRKSNETEETVRIEVENLTGESWPIRLVDRIPYSEQEDLKISSKIVPAPDATDIDGKRGVMEWRFDLTPGGRQEISLSHSLTWPEGKVLR